MKRAAFTGADFRFTTKGNTLYAIALAWPDNGRLVVKSLGTGAGLLEGEIKKVKLFGFPKMLELEQTNEGLLVKLPEKPPCDFAVMLKIEYVLP